MKYPAKPGTARATSFGSGVSCCPSWSALAEGIGAPESKDSGDVGSSSEQAPRASARTKHMNQDVLPFIPTSHVAGREVASGPLTRRISAPLGWIRGFASRVPPVERGRPLEIVQGGT